MTKILQGEALVQKAAALAEHWHDGQAHSFGPDSYFNSHLKPVAEIVQRLGYGALYRAGAFLHDIKEDTPISDAELAAEGIPLPVIHAINVLAKRPGQPHKAYLADIQTDPIATVDKFADSSFNYAWTILNSPGISDERFGSWALEYAHNIAVLRPALPSPDQIPPSTT